VQVRSERQRLLVPVFVQRSLLLLCIALNFCQSHNANSAASIEFTYIPPATRSVQPWPPYLGS
jgi:hypothetical protein